MPIPKSLEALMDHGVVEQVVRPLRSGKEAEVYLVVSEGAYRVAKVYKEAQNRTFRNRATYTEGRRVRNTRDQRAMAKRTNHGKARDEAAWRSTEVDIIYKLRAAGVRVPTPYHFVDGVLIMELVQTVGGDPAPRLGEVNLTPSQAEALYLALVGEVMRMLCAGVVHGDLSEFNVLMGQTGPCIIDFPQSVHAANNANARKLLLRDVSNLHRFLQRFVPGRPPLAFGEEMWQLYERGELTPDTRLTGRYTPAARTADLDVVLAIIEDAKRDAQRHQERTGASRGYARKKSVPPAPTPEKRSEPQRARRPRHAPADGSHRPRGAAPEASAGLRVSGQGGGRRPDSEGSRGPRHAGGSGNAPRSHGPGSGHSHGPGGPSDGPPRSPSGGRRSRRRR